ncbi:EAL domain-containing protein [Halomonas icarae]|uniref:EAL domain-containing protein n=1 Tax=Halomonas icarae TaxID=2691040 RepID=A0A7X4VYG7_9GAMM|nr:EAL domain-containing protein [Halomonas icarae]MDR5901835.1 EAL domain-containing protein [Halomonas icarae]NAW12667.1 EAL domain-containing protein [Halomonas icarae]
MRSAPPPAVRRRRLSLTWRVIALSSLLVLGLVLAFSWIGHANLSRQFEQSRLKNAQRQASEMHQAIQRSEESVRQLASLVAATQGLGAALPDRGGEALPETLEPQWPTLQLESGVDEILIFDTQGTQTASWGAAQSSHGRPVQRWVQRVIDTDKPLTSLRCSIDCRQYAAVPVLVEGRSVGVVVLSRSLADVMRQAHQITQGDVGLLLVEGTQSRDLPEERWLSEWRGQLIALTGQDESLPALRQASRETRLEELTQRPYRFRHATREIEVSGVSMSEDDDQRGAGYILFTNDITDQVEAIRQDTRTLAIIGLGGWLAAELLLLAILLSPMARLRRISGILPSLAQGEFDSARRAIPRPDSRFPDEIDSLEGATLHLANQLEDLEEEVGIRGDELAARVEELAQERDFIGSLLDTARVFIITLDADDRITLVNDYALSVMGVNEKLLLKRLFDDVFGPHSQPLVGIDGRGQEERLLVTPNGHQHTIAWYHAPLPGMAGEAAGRISVGLDITERKVAEARLTWLAERDPLTGLYNRRFFKEALDDAITQEHSGALLLLDLDQFKDVNELSGHQAGDQLLRQVARVMQEELGHRGTLARLGGDEFALLVRGADRNLATRIAQQINQLLATVTLELGERRHRIAASTGIALFPTHGDNATDLLASADMAMYKAKESSSQRWHLLSTLENARGELKERVYWEERIHRALEENAFVLMVQPIVRLRDRDIRHYEVLIRMQDDSGELISPGAFISVAEHSGQILQIDRWVIHQALDVLAKLKGKEISLAINLSGPSLHDEDLKQYLAEEIITSGVAPEQLILEVTETAAVTDFATARGVLQSLRDLGCRTALDDFGVGFSNFHYLSRLPVDYIKIDGSFIRQLLDDNESRVIVKAIADIANGFDKQVVAEFVEQEAQLPILASYGISYGQGYYLGSPIKASTAFALNENHDFASDTPPRSDTPHHY